MLQQTSLSSPPLTWYWSSTQIIQDLTTLFNNVEYINSGLISIADLIQSSSEEYILYLTTILTQQTQYFNTLNSNLDTQTIILNKLLSCCNSLLIPTIPRFIPGDCNYTPPVMYPSCPGAGGEFVPYPTTPVPVYVNQNMRLYPVKKGCFAIIGIPGDWKPLGCRIINITDGVDLSHYLPKYYNYMTGIPENLELIRIIGYKFHNDSQGKQPMLIYEVRDVMTGVIKIYDANLSAWNGHRINR